MIKRNSDYKKVFKQLNLKLGNDALSDNFDKATAEVLVEEKDIKEQLDEEIRTTGALLFRLKNNKVQIDNFEKEEDFSDDKCLVYDISEENILKETSKKRVLKKK